jgi:hypothetical protein
MGSKSNVNPDHYKTAGRDPQGRSVLQEVERQKFKEGQAQLSRSSKSAVPSPGRKNNPADPTVPKQLTKPAKDRAIKPVAKNIGENLQASDKTGKASMAQKKAGSRHGLNSTPATRPVAGAYGKRKAAIEIVAMRDDYDSKKQSLSAAKKSVNKEKPAANRSPAAKKK